MGSPVVKLLELFPLDDDLNLPDGREGDVVIPKPLLTQSGIGPGNSFGLKFSVRSR